MKLYSRLKNEKTMEHEVVNQEDARILGWEENELEVGADGKFYAAGFAPKKIIKTTEEQRIARAQAYAAKVDPLTSQIQRLKDFESTEENEHKIKILMAERDSLVLKIKADYPYPETEPVVEDTSAFNIKYEPYDIKKIKREQEIFAAADDVEGGEATVFDVVSFEDMPSSWKNDV